MTAMDRSEGPCRAPTRRDRTDPMINAPGVAPWTGLAALLQMSTVHRCQRRWKLMTNHRSWEPSHHHGVGTPFLEAQLAGGREVRAGRFVYPAPRVRDLAEAQAFVGQVVASAAW